MKKSILSRLALLALAATAFTFSSCSKDDYEEPELTVAPTYSQIIFSADGQTATANGATITPEFTVATNQLDWSVDDDADWLSIEVDKPAGTFTLSAAANPSVEPRGQATVTVTAAGATPVILTVTQFGVPQYAVTVTTTDGGTASATPAPAPEGAQVTLTAVPDDGYGFAGWTVAGGDVSFDVTENPVTFVMPPTGVIIHATFYKEAFDVYSAIADAAFRQFCANFDNDHDGKLSLDEAAGVTIIDLHAAGIRDVASLAGIEYFTTLEQFNCSYNAR